MMLMKAPRPAIHEGSLVGTFNPLSYACYLEPQHHDAILPLKTRIDFVIKVYRPPINVAILQVINI